MPYFKELQRLMNEVLLWADQCHERGIDVSPDMDRVGKDLLRVRKRLENSASPATALSREPDELAARKFNICVFFG